MVAMRGAELWTQGERGASRVHWWIGCECELSRMTARLRFNLLSGRSCCSLEQERQNLMCIVLERPGSELLIGERMGERRESHEGLSSPTQHGRDDELAMAGKPLILPIPAVVAMVAQGKEA